MEKTQAAPFTDLLMIRHTTDHPPSWSLKYEGRGFEVPTTKQLMSYASVRRHVTEQTLRLPPPLTPRQWENVLAELFRGEVPADWI